MNVWFSLEELLYSMAQSPTQLQETSTGSFRSLLRPFCRLLEPFQMSNRAMTAIALKYQQVSRSWCCPASFSVPIRGGFSYALKVIDPTPTHGYSPWHSTKVAPNPLRIERPRRLWDNMPSPICHLVSVRSSCQDSRVATTRNCVFQDNVLPHDKNRPMQKRLVDQYILQFQTHHPCSGIPLCPT